MIVPGSKLLVGMIHTGPLPGAPRPGPGVAALAAAAAAEARLYAGEGFGAVLVENIHDLPYPRRVAPPETVAAMAVITAAVRAAVPGLACGVQILAGANAAALAVAQATGCTFIRCEGFVFGHLADEGWMDADAAELARMRARLAAGEVRIWADIRKKHSAHAATADLEAADWARGAEWNGADALVVTGRHTGLAADREFLGACRAHTSLPVVVGSGLGAANLAEYWPLADAFIVGSSLKTGGDWRGPLDAEMVAAFAAAARACGG
jgi:uncharacterized protein